MPCLPSYLRFLLYVAILSASPCHCKLDQRAMSKPQQCPGKAIAAAHRFRTVSARSAVECVSFCKPNDRCVSVVYEGDRRLCHLGNATIAEAGCAAMETANDSTVYYEAKSARSPVQCQNGGTPNPDSNNCSCPVGYHGDACDSTFQDCDDYLELGQMVEKALHWIIPPSSPFDTVLVRCELKSGTNSGNQAKTVILVRQDEAADFNRSWLEYRDGFGEAGSSTHWLGWEKVQAITSKRPYILRVTVKNPSLQSAVYGSVFNFTVRFDQAAGGYMLSSSKVSQLQSCFLGDAESVAFSAHDLDNDGSATVNCAALYGGGWWFKGDNCSPCNPFGPILPPYNGTLQGGTPAEGVMHTVKFGDVVPFEMEMCLIRNVS